MRRCVGSRIGSFGISDHISEFPPLALISTLLTNTSYIPGLYAGAFFTSEAKYLKWKTKSYLRKLLGVICLGVGMLSHNPHHTLL